MEIFFFSVLPIKIVHFHLWKVLLTYYSYTLICLQLILLVTTLNTIIIWIHYPFELPFSIFLLIINYTLVSISL